MYSQEDIVILKTEVRHHTLRKQVKILKKKILVSIWIHIYIYRYMCIYIHIYEYVYIYVYISI